MRALLIINPHATSMSGHEAGLVVRELGSRLDLETVQTQYRGHAGELAAASAAQGFDLVVTFGGDGTVNEVVNGLMNARVPDYTGPPCGGAAASEGSEGSDGSGRTEAADGTGGVRIADIPEATARPAIAPVPGGGANVFARTLGLPPEPSAAVRRILAAAEAGARRTIGLGLAGDRFFTFSAGLGVDAEVMADVERLRARGRQASTMLYLRTALRRYYVTDRRRPALTLLAPDQPPVRGLFMGVVTNSSPWTYLGSRPVRPAPHTDFNSGLDLFALRRLRTLTTLAALRHMMHTNEEPPSGRDVVSAAALTELTFQADRPMAFHIDGEYLGKTEEVAFRFVPAALCVLALHSAHIVIDLTPNS